MGERITRETAVCPTCGAMDVSQEWVGGNDGRWQYLDPRDCGHWTCPSHFKRLEEEDEDVCKSCYEARYDQQKCNEERARYKAALEKIASDCNCPVGNVKEHYSDCAAGIAEEALSHE